MAVMVVLPQHRARLRKKLLMARRALKGQMLLSRELRQVDRLVPQAELVILAATVLKAATVLTAPRV